ncbi:DUF6531 domain-containing protein [Psychromonas aquimarina]|uniref:DUF6531 domain-containing protein n=1 Tax=Psychromonas aquimarina TaxID=444919 RepID=UPI000683EF1D|nr:DUF6531 domain-containing protein [Psychromonas aquimarina]
MKKAQSKLVHTGGNKYKLGHKLIYKNTSSRKGFSIRNYHVPDITSHQVKTLSYEGEIPYNFGYSCTGYNVTTAKGEWKFISWMSGGGGPAGSLGTFYKKDITDTVKYSTPISRKKECTPRTHVNKYTHSKYIFYGCEAGYDPLDYAYKGEHVLPTCKSSLTSKIIEYKCYAPFTVGDETLHQNTCAASCPPESSFLDVIKNSDGSYSGSGRCLAPENKQEPLQQCVSNPVMVSNGTKVQYETPDIKVAGAFPLSFSRSYNSQRSLEALELRQSKLQLLPQSDKSTWTTYVQPADYKGLKTQMLVPPVLPLVNNVRAAGFKSWSHSYSGQLDALNDGASVRLSSSAFVNRAFTKQSDGTYKPDNLTSDTLTRVLDESGGLLHWLYRSADNQLEYYNAQGLLTRRVNRAGLSHHLTYDANNQLDLVKDDAGNQLDFNFDTQGKLLTLETSKGELITYGYDQYANLESVTKKLASGKESVRIYHYEDSRHPYALTGITDENNARYATWEYDELGRAITSKHADDNEKTSFDFETNKTTVTNPLGKQTVYHYKDIAGAKRLDTVEGVASASCLAANQNYEYYDDGQLKSKTDWKGIKTTFEYNDRGLEKQRTEAAGTKDERVITTTWHDKFNLPETVTVGSQVTTYSYDTNGQLLSKKLSKI